MSCGAKNRDFRPLCPPLSPGHPEDRWKSFFGNIPKKENGQHYNSGNRSVKIRPKFNRVGRPKGNKFSHNPIFFDNNLSRAHPYNLNLDSPNCNVFRHFEGTIICSAMRIHLMCFLRERIHLRWNAWQVFSYFHGQTNKVLCSLCLKGNATFFSWTMNDP